MIVGKIVYVECFKSTTNANYTNDKLSNYKLPVWKSANATLGNDQKFKI